MMMYSFKLSTLSKYILRKYLPYLVVSSIFFSAVILVFYLKEIVREAISKHIDISIVMELVFYSLGWTISMTIPMSVLLSVILAVGALNSDSEIIAMRSGGISYRRIIWPYAQVGILLTAFFFWYNHSVVPGLYNKMMMSTQKILHSDPVAVIEPGYFVTIDEVGNKKKEVIFVEKVESEKNLSGQLYGITLQTFVRSKQGVYMSRIISAERGEKIKKGNVKAVRLYNGFIIESDQRGRQLSFLDFSNGNFDLHLITENMTRYKPSETEVAFFSDKELRERIKKWKKKKNKNLQIKGEVEAQNRNSLSLAALLFTIVGFPLGISNIRSGKGVGLGVSIALIFVYFAFYLLAGTIAHSGVPATIAAWLGNIIFVFIGIYLYISRILEVSIWQLLFRK